MSIMKLQRVNLHDASGAKHRRAAGGILAAVPLSVAQATCAVIGLLVVVLDLVSIPAAYTIMRTPCVVCDPNSIQFSVVQVQQISMSGLSFAFIATYKTGIIVVTQLVYIILGALLFLRRSDDRMALFTSLTLITFGGAAFTGTMHAYSNMNEALWLVTDGLNVIGQISFFVFLCIFPTGRFVPRWAIIPCAIWALSWILQILQIPALSAVASQVNDGPLFLVLLFSLIGAQMYRYRRVSSPIQKQQTKWVVYGIGMGLSVFALSIAISSQLPASVSNNPLSTLIGNTIAYACFLLIPSAIVVAILRSRLYDIDILINRTLVYGSLTAILAALYFALVLTAQSVTRLITGATQPQPPIVIVLSTLLIAALVQPLRRRLQRGIDRRFYRSRYDATETVEAFSASLRSEVDLAQLSDHLLGVVDRTMRPRHVSLWLSPVDRPHPAPRLAQRRERQEPQPNAQLEEHRDS